MVGKSTRLQVIPQQSTQNTANLPLQTYEKNQCTFFIVQHGRRLKLPQQFKKKTCNVDYWIVVIIILVKYLVVLSPGSQVYSTLYYL